METTAENKLALFDFDGTLTCKDSLFELIKFIHGKQPFYKGLLTLFPGLLLYKLKMVSNWKAKEKVLTYFFRGMSSDIFQNYCNRFVLEVMPVLLRKDAEVMLKQLKDHGARVVIVTASAENWIMPWCRSLNIECIASKLEVSNGKMTGKLSGKNCYGMGKVRRIKEYLDLSKYDTIYAFGDSKGDLPMLELATDRYYKPFRTNLKPQTSNPKPQ